MIFTCTWIPKDMLDGYGTKTNILEVKLERVIFIFYLK
jgi:hypothetical protein